jgi:hypothetical protein
MLPWLNVMVAHRRLGIAAIGAAALGGGLIGVGLLGIFELYGLLPLVLGLLVVALSVWYSTGIRWVWLLITAVLAAACTVSFMAWGAEHIWTQPSCSQHPNQLSGQFTYWSGATVTWICVNGQPVITHDSR